LPPARPVHVAHPLARTATTATNINSIFFIIFFFPLITYSYTKIITDA